MLRLGKKKHRKTHENRNHYFRKQHITQIFPKTYSEHHKKINNFECHHPDTEVSFLSLGLILKAFHTSHSLNTKRYNGAKKHIVISHKNFTSQMHQYGFK